MAKHIATWSVLVTCLHDIISKAILDSFAINIFVLYKRRKHSSQLTLKVLHLFKNETCFYNLFVDYNCGHFIISDLTLINMIVMIFLFHQI